MSKSMSTAAGGQTPGPKAAGAQAVWPWWVLANVFGGVVGQGLYVLVMALIAPPGSGEGSPFWAAFFFAPILTWLALGIAQWMVLRPYLAVKSRMAARIWLAGSVLGGVGAIVAGLLGGIALAFLAFFPLAAATGAANGSNALEGPLGIAASVVPAIGGGAVAGLVIGGAQALMLSSYLQRVSRWVWANAAGWAAGLLLGSSTWDPSLSFVGMVSPSDPFATLAGGTIAVTVAAAITGLALPKLLASPILPEDKEGMASRPSPRPGPQ
jgi:hypothetical protein